MRTFIFLLCTTVFSLTTENSFSQEKIIIDQDQLVTVDQVFKIIKKQTNYDFIYQKRIFKKSPKVQLKKGEILVTKLLEKSLSTSNVKFKLSKNNTIVINENDMLEPVIKTSQGVQISGIVTDANNQPLPGANIIEKGTSNGAQTDFDGNFSLDVASNSATLVVSYLGFETQEVLVNNKTTITIILQENAAGLDEVVVVGYGTQSKVKLSNAVGTLKSEDLVSAGISSFEEGIAGQLSGVQIIQTTGAPGSTSSINIRGIGSLTAGTSPLIVVDGFPSENLSLNAINPSEIESVDILKDAAAAAIYGSRGANGVILVTTKKGKLGDVKISYDGYTGFQNVTKTIDTQDAYQRAAFVYAAGKSLGLFEPYVIGYQGLTNTNWQDEIFRNALMHNHVITASGATEKMNYFVSGGYLDQEGVIEGSWYKRFNFRANLNFDISEKFKAGFNIAPSYSKENKISEADHKRNGVVINALIANPIFSPYNSDGSLNLSSDMLIYARNNGFATTENPLALALLNEDKRSEFNLLGGGFLEFKPTEAFSFKTYIGINYASATRDQYSPDTVGAYAIAAENKQANAFSGFSERINWVIENTVGYQKTFSSNHNLKVLLGQSFQVDNRKTNYPSALSSQVIDVSGVLTTAYPLFEDQWSLISYLGRVNYDFNDKYILSGSIRRDGSSRFGANTKWGWFPSVSGAWRISQEEFFKEGFISELKLRGSWGVTGNNSIPNYGSIPLLGASDYVGNTGVSPRTSPNENLSWEQTNTIDAGIDIGFFNNKLNLTADYYEAITNDLLLNVPVPAHSGNTSSLRNIGKVKNTGLELSISTSNVKLGGVTWSGAFNISTNKNEILELGPGQDRILTTSHISQIGKPLGAFYLYQLEGVFETQEQIDNAPTHPEQELGDYIFTDVNGDGSITSDDRKISGDFFPDYTFGFSSTLKYKNIDFSFLIQGKQGYEIYNATGFFLRNLEGWGNGHNDINNYYTPRNLGATYAHPGKHVKTYENSNLLLEDGSFIRFRKISLGYTLPESITEKLDIDKLKIYITGRNLFTITDYSGYNPEVSSSNKSWNSSTITPGVDYGAYPVAKSVVVGVNLSF